MVVIALGLTAPLWAAYRFTPIGLAIRASSENQRAAATLGWSPDVLATVTWALGAALAGVAGDLIAPLTGSTRTSSRSSSSRCSRPRCVGGFTSFCDHSPAPLRDRDHPVGVQPHYVHVRGLVDRVPVPRDLVLLLIRGQGLPRPGPLGRAARRARHGPRPLARGSSVAVVSFALALIFVVPDTALVDALTISLGWAIVMLLGRPPARLHGPALARAVRARRARGVDRRAPRRRARLAVRARDPRRRRRRRPDRRALRGPGAPDARRQPRGRDARARDAASTDGVHEHALGRRADGTSRSGRRHFFGIDIDPIRHADRYAPLRASSSSCSARSSVANVRRGSVGRRLIAVRTNERAAAALGISVFGAKLFAFVLALRDRGDRRHPARLPHTTRRRTATSSPLQSILAVTYAVIGGVGFVLGAPLRLAARPGRLRHVAARRVLRRPEPAWLVVIGGITVIVLIVASTRTARSASTSS